MISNGAFLFTTILLYSPVASAFVPVRFCQRRAVDRTPCEETQIAALPDPDAIQHLSTMLVSEKDYGEVFKTAAIVATLGGGLIPATISANSAMFRTLSGKKDASSEEDIEKKNPGESFDPTIGETKYRRYVEDSGAEGK